MFTTTAKPMDGSLSANTIHAPLSKLKTKTSILNIDLPFKVALPNAVGNEKVGVVQNIEIIKTLMDVKDGCTRNAPS
jgi:hypothetical protein